MYHLIYYFSFVLSLLFFAALAHFYKKHISVYYAALFIAISVCSFGTLQLSYAKDLSAAIYANQVNYLGSCFTPFFSFICVAELTKTKVPSWIKVLIFLISCAVVGCVATIGTYPIYYKTVDIEHWNGLTYLVKEYGPLHNLYPIFIGALTIASIIIILISFVRRKQVSAVTSITLFIIMVISLFTYAVERALKLKVELVPLAFNMEQLGVLFLLERISLYDVSDFTTTSMMKSNLYGIVTFKSKCKFIGSDGAANEWFPELKELNVDEKITATHREKSDFLDIIANWVNGAEQEDTVYLERNDKIIEVKFSITKTRYDRNVYVVTLRDDTKQQNLNRLIQDYNGNLEKKVSEKTDKLKQIQEDIIISMASIVENRDGNTGGHIKRTSDIMRIFVNALIKTNNFKELTPAVSESIIKAAPLHDFGKIGIPDSVLNKPGKFTDEEYAIMKLHPEKGAVIVAQMLQNSDDILFNNIAVNVAHYHHEKWNGTGYPKGLKEKAIPFEARVMALADVFDALVSKRVYKDQFSYDTAFKIIEESCGQHFDPLLCSEFLKCRPQLEALYNSYGD